MERRQLEYFITVVEHGGRLGVGFGMWISIVIRPGSRGWSVAVTDEPGSRT